jgi:hypothetical protein
MPLHPILLNFLKYEVNFLFFCISVVGHQTGDHQLSGPYVVKHADGHRTDHKTVLINSLVVLTKGSILMVIILVISGHSDFSSPSGSYVVKPTDGYHIDCHQTVDHQLRGPYVVKHTGWLS